MKFKYMIRGMGLGIIMTAAVMGAYGRKAVADARVAVLKEYGLGSNSALGGEDGTESAATSETGSEEASTEPVIVRDEKIEAEISSVLDAAKESEQASSEAPETGTVAETASATEQPEVKTVADNGDDTDAAGERVFQITISKGDDSGTVARKLQTAGIIDDAAAFDSYLKQRGYDRKISTGTKNITIGKDEKDETEIWLKVTKIITGN